MTRPSNLAIFLFALLGVFPAPAQPVNDNFANRIPIVWPGTNVTISGTLANASFETGEPFLNGISSGQTAWWTWIAPSNGIVTLSLTGSGFNPLLAVYSGDALPGLSLVASNNYLTCYENVNCGCHWRERGQISFHVSSGQAYHLVVDSAMVTEAGWGMRSFSPEDLILPDAPVQWGFQLFTYWVPVHTTNVFAGGEMQLGLSFAPAPGNDDYEHPLKLTGLRPRIAASNYGAGKQSGEPNCLGNSGGSSVWYSWKASASGRVTLSTNSIAPYLPPSWSQGGYAYGLVSYYVMWVNYLPTCGNEIDQNPPPVFYPLLAAYTGTNLSSLVPASNFQPMNLDAYPHAVEFDAAKGQTYQIAFDGNRGTTGAIPLYLALTKPASNDHFRNRIQMHGINVAASGYNAGATHEAGEPSPVGSVGKSVWWSWVAPVSGIVAVNMDGSERAFPVTVFTGSEVNHLNLIAEGTGSFSFEAVQGQNYRLSINDVSGLTGAIKLKLQAPVVELPLERVRRQSSKGSSGRTALLSFTASPRQVVLLQSSDDGTTWNNVRTALARQTTVDFLARPVPTESGPYYRAIVVDYQ